MGSARSKISYRILRELAVWWMGEGLLLLCVRFMSVFAVSILQPLILSFLGSACCWLSVENVCCW